MSYNTFWELIKEAADDPPLHGAGWTAPSPTAVTYPMSTASSTTNAAGYQVSSKVDKTKPGHGFANIKTIDLMNSSDKRHMQYAANRSAAQGPIDKKSLRRIFK
jgi:hypothetical protein